MPEKCFIRNDEHGMAGVVPFWGGMRRIFVLREPEIQRCCAAYISRLNVDGQNLFRVLVEPYEDDQKREQQEKYHAMIGDIARQLEFMGKKRDVETWKRLLVEAFVHVMREDAMAMGKSDPFRGRGELIPSLDGKRFVQLGVQSRRFGKGVASAFIAYLEAYGAQNGVRFTGARR